VTQVAAAKILGVSRIAFCSWEDGSHAPTFENEMRYRQFLSDCETYAQELEAEGEKATGGNG
jgi:DNA-binding XRE family transcriptional regulator